MLSRSYCMLFLQFLHVLGPALFSKVRMYRLGLLRVERIETFFL